LKLKNVATIIISVTLVAACETTDQQQVDIDDIEGSEEFGEEQGNDFADEDVNNENENEFGNNENSNDMDNNQFANDNFANNENDDNEFVNNANDSEQEDQFAFFNDQGQQQTEQAELTNNAELDLDPLSENQGALNQELLAGQSANEIPSETSAPASGGLVRYAISNVSIYDGPDGQVVGSLEQGDHPLVYTEAGWFKMFDGRYVMETGLAAKGVGRPRNNGNWQ
jgi:hypothetical protein